MITDQGKKPNSLHYANAAYIVGILMHSGDLYPIDDEGKPNEHEWSVALKLIAACLRDLYPESRDWCELPFEW